MKHNEVRTGERGCKKSRIVEVWDSPTIVSNKVIQAYRMGQRLGFREKAKKILRLANRASDRNAARSREPIGKMAGIKAINAGLSMRGHMMEGPFAGLSSGTYGQTPEKKKKAVAIRPWKSEITKNRDTRNVIQSIRTRQAGGSMRGRVMEAVSIRILSLYEAARAKKSGLFRRGK